MENEMMLELLQQSARVLQPVVYLEVGVNEGRSLAAVLQVCRPSMLILCDNWGSEFGGTGRGNHDHVEEMLRDYSGSVKWLDGDSHMLLPQLRETVDLALVDGDHSAAGALADLQDVWPRLRPGGRLLFDDITHPGHRYLDQVVHDFAVAVGATILCESRVGYGVVVLGKNGTENK